MTDLTWYHAPDCGWDHSTRPRKRPTPKCSGDCGLASLVTPAPTILDNLSDVIAQVEAAQDAPSRPKRKYTRKPKALPQEPASDAPATLGDAQDDLGSA